MVLKILYSKYFILLWAILIFIGCSLPGKEIPKVSLFDNVDKVVHFVFFFVLVWCWLKSKYANKWFIVSVAILYGYLLEAYQLHFVAGRSFDTWDIVADSTGALVAFLLARRN